MKFVYLRFVTVLIAALLLWSGFHRASAQLPAGVDATVVKIVDGDTIEVEIRGRRFTLRYIGIDTPESVQPGTPVECFAKEATAYNQKLALGKRVRLEKDVSEVDRFGRLLRYVYLPDGQMLNEQLVRGGYAQAISYPPDIKYQTRLLRAQRAAVAAKAGLWGACPLSSTSASTSATAVSPQPAGTTVVSGSCPKGCEVPPTGCLIKGNISSNKNEKIYHMPGQRDYTKTEINSGKGERWFCTEQEARQNGWRKAER